MSRSTGQMLNLPRSGVIQLAAASTETIEQAPNPVAQLRYSSLLISGFIVLGIILFFAGIVVLQPRSGPGGGALYRLRMLLSCSGGVLVGVGVWMLLAGRQG